MTLDQLFLLAGEARRRIGHTEYVVVGSLSVLGLAAHTTVPDEMAMSNDVDCYSKSDPERVLALTQELGEESDFYRQQGFYLDPVSPRLLTLPDGWAGRMHQVQRDGLRLWFLEPNDAAISKYARSEPRDLRWIRAGIAAGIVSLPAVRARLGGTLFLDEEEERRVRAQVDADSTWFEARRLRSRR